MSTAAGAQANDGTIGISADAGAPPTFRPFEDERLASTTALAAAQVAVAEALHVLAMRPAGLDAATADLLVRLHKAPECGIRGVQIGELCQMSPTRVSRLVDRAEADGLVSRQPDPQDRRAQHVVLTEKGLLAVRRYAPLLDDVLDDIVFATFTSAERATLVGLLDRVRDRARDLLAAEGRHP